MRNQSPRRLSSGAAAAAAGGGGGGGGQFKWADNWLRESRDEDLALFQDMRSRERKNFLHPSNDDIESSLSIKFEGLSGIPSPASSTPPRNKGNDLLSTDADKNDYDWLLTPPGTPLFPSLDKDTPLQMERTIFQTHSASKISRFSGSNGRDVRSKLSRPSPSPRTPTVSSMSSNTRGRASSPSRVNSSPTLRPSTPTRSLVRSSTTLNSRVSTRSSPPTLRRMNTSPTVRSSSTERSASIKGRTRGTSLSPKLQAWQSPELGFSSEPPPNLRTSLPDRSTLTSRGNSANSRHGTSLDARHSYSEALEITQSRWRHSSSSASRVSSSSTSQDRWSSKGSTISSSDDGTEISHPGYLDYSTGSPNSTIGDANSVLRMENNVRNTYSPIMKRPIKTHGNSAETSGVPTATATARKSLEASMRRVDHRRVPQNMFRPLLSSAPASSLYYTPQSVDQHRPVSPAVDNSFTASSNASSEQGVRIFPRDESSDEGETEIESRWDHHLTSGAPMIKIKVAQDDLTNPDYIDRLLGNCGYADQLEQESVCDSSSSPMGAAHSGVSDMKSTALHKTPDATVLDSGIHGASYLTKARTEEVNSPSFNEKVSNGDHLNYSSLDDNSTDLQDAVVSPRSQATPEQAFVDTQEDIPLQSASSITQDCDSLLKRREHDNQLLDNCQVSSPLGKFEQAEVTETISADEHLQSLQGQGTPIWWEEFNAKYPADHDSHFSNQSIQGGYPNLIISTSNMTESSSSNTLSVGRVDTSPHGRMILEEPEKMSSVVHTNACTKFDLTDEENEIHVTTGIDASLESPCSAHRLTCSKRADGDIPASTSNHIPGKEHEDFELPVKENILISRKEDSVAPNFDMPFQEHGQVYFIDIPETTDDAAIRCSESTIFTSSRKPPFSEECSLVDEEEDPQVEGEVLERLKKAVPLKENLEATLTEHRGIMAADADPSVSSLTANYNSHVNATETADFHEEVGIPASSAACLDLHLESCQESSELEQAPEDEPDEEAVKIKEDLHQISSLVSEMSDVAEVEMSISDASLLSGTTPIEDECKTKQFANLGLEGNVMDEKHESQDSTTSYKGLGQRPNARSFSLEEATNTILFCSSIVHDIVYKAASAAAEKEQTAITKATLPNPAIFIEAASYRTPSADYKNPFKGRASKSKNWKGRPKEAVSSVQQNKEQATDGGATTSVHPPAVPDGMKVDADEKNKPSTETVKEKSHLKLSVNSNCQCTIM